MYPDGGSRLSHGRPGAPTRRAHHTRTRTRHDPQGGQETAATCGPAPADDPSASTGSPNTATPVGAARREESQSANPHLLTAVRHTPRERRTHVEAVQADAHEPAGSAPAEVSRRRPGRLCSRGLEMPPLLRMLVSRAGRRLRTSGSGPTDRRPCSPFRRARHQPTSPNSALKRTITREPPTETSRHGLFGPHDLSLQRQAVAPPTRQLGDQGEAASVLIGGAGSA